MLHQQPLLPPNNIFLQNLYTSIEPHLYDGELTVQKLTRIAAISRTDLHRKLRREAGMHTTQYIRYIRLSKAADLLIQKPHWTIFQVALEVGFNTHSYFSKCFQKVFGVSPKVYRSRNGDLEHLR